MIHDAVSRWGDHITRLAVIDSIAYCSLGRVTVQRELLKLGALYETHDLQVFNCANRCLFVATDRMGHPGRSASKRLNVYRGT